eukprot:PhM_4_TR15457/c0_g1_i1/m.913
MPRARHSSSSAIEGHSLVSHGGGLYLYGGRWTTVSSTMTTTEYSDELFYLSATAITASAATQQQKNSSSRTNDNNVQLELVVNHQKQQRSELIAMGGPSSGVAPSPPAVAYHSACLFGSQMIVTGGVGDTPAPAAAAAAGGNSNNTLSGGDMKTVWCCDLNSLVWRKLTTTGDVPMNRCHHVTAAVAGSSEEEGGYIYLHGGYPLLSHGGSGGKSVVSNQELESMHHVLYSSVYRLHLESLTWQRIDVSGGGGGGPSSASNVMLGPMLWGHTVVPFHHNLILFGGVNVQEHHVGGGQEENNIVVWNPNNAQFRWVNFASNTSNNTQTDVSVPQPRALHSAVFDPQSNQMIVFGGFTMRATAKLRDVWTFDLAAGRWRSHVCTGNAPTPRSGHAAAIYAGYMIVYGGSEANTSVTSSAPSSSVVYVLDLRTFHWSAKDLGPSTTMSGQKQRPTNNNNNKTGSVRNEENRDPADVRHSEGAGAGDAGDGDYDDNSRYQMSYSSPLVQQAMSRVQSIRQLADSVSEYATESSNRGSKASYSYPQQQQPPSTSKFSSSPSPQQPQAPTPPPPPPPAPPQQFVPNDSSSSDATAARLIESQRSEIEMLKAQLEHLTRMSQQQQQQQQRHTPLHRNEGGISDHDPQNPYEVPVFNSSDTSRPLWPRHSPNNIGGVAMPSPSASTAMLSSYYPNRPTGGTDSIFDLTPPPRLNLRLADDPSRTSGAAMSNLQPTLSRGAVTGLVAPVLSNFEAAAAHNKGGAATSINPLSALLNIPLPSSSANHNYNYASGSTSTPPPPSVSAPSTAMQNNSSNNNNNNFAIGSSGVYDQQQPQRGASVGYSSGLSGGGTAAAALRSPSLRSVIRGESTMLSIRHAGR